MKKLQSLKNTELSEYCINILAKQNIHFVNQFLAEKSSKLSTIANLSNEQIDKIKAALKNIYGGVVKNFDEAYEEFIATQHNYSTLIGPLDDLLSPLEEKTSNHLTSKCMWEICGPYGVGKTQLALTLLVNFVQMHQCEALYIDTKLDFSASRVKNMLRSRQQTPKIISDTLQAIKVERVFSAQAVVEMLDTFYLELQNGGDFKDIKLIIIDSLPAVWFLLKADVNRLAGKWLLSRLSQIIYRLCDEYSIAVICINLSITPQEDKSTTSKTSTLSNGDQDISDILENDELDLETKTLTYRQVMGQFWLSKPRLRLSMEYISEADKERTPRRLLKVLHSTCLPKKGSCIVRLCDQGVV